MIIVALAEDKERMKDPQKWCWHKGESRLGVSMRIVLLSVKLYN